LGGPTGIGDVVGFCGRKMPAGRPFTSAQDEPALLAAADQLDYFVGVIRGYLCVCPARSG
jgi:hypothetical protein